MEELIGSKIKNLELAIDQGRVSHAYLFVGPKDSEKFNTALELAGRLLCENGKCNNCRSCHLFAKQLHPDTLILNGIESIKIEETRRIKEFASLKPYQASKKIIIINKIERLTKEAANSILKILEEPEERTVFILTATNRADVLETILSRCQIVPFFSGNSSDRNEVFIEDFANLAERDLTDRFNFAEKLLSEEDLPEIIDSFSLYYRDILLAKSGVFDKIINQKYFNEIKNKSLQFSVKEIVEILGNIKNLQNSLGLGINTKLQLENLFLKI